MKLLVIICSHKFDVSWYNNIIILNDYMKNLNDYMQNFNIEVDYSGISSQDDFHNYESIISFKYKTINTKYQFSKICDFITDKNYELDYDWYMKIRPDLKLLENINFNLLSVNAINARARVYFGPKKIKYGMSINLRECYYDDNEHNVIVDDQLFIFHKNVLQKGAFDKIEAGSVTGWWGTNENEWVHSIVFESRNIPINVIGINLEFIRDNSFSADLNIY